METGIKGSESILVDDTNTAQTIGSGTLQVFATPAMIALIEHTAWTSVEKVLEDGCGTVGTRLDITHEAPTPLGMRVTCESELVKIDGRKLVFDVKVYDEQGLIGQGTHERFIVDNDKFQKKANKKSS